MGKDEQDSPFGLKDHWRWLVAMSLVSLSTFQYGLEFGIVSGLQAMIPFLEVFGYADTLSPTGWNITSERQQLVSSLMTLGAFITSATAGLTSTVAGRKVSLWVACALCVVATVMMQTTTSIGVLYAARLIIGLANGLFMTHFQLWILETRTLIGTIVDNFASYRTDKLAYIIPLGIVYISPGLLAIGLLFIPESPRWLLGNKEEHTERARDALRWLRPTGWDVDSEVAEAKLALDTERELQSGTAIWDLFANPVNRRRTLLSVGAILCQASSGSMFMLAFGTYFFAIAGIGKPFENSVIFIAVSVLSVLINSAVVTRFGYRRTMMILVIAAVWHARPFPSSSGSVVVALSVIYMFFYGGCISSYAWMAGGEMPSQRLRSYTFGFSTAIGFLGAWLIVFTAPYFINPAELNWGPKYGYIWFGSCFVSAIWLFLYLPETKNRTLEEIDEMFQARILARKFQGYQCAVSVQESEDSSSDRAASNSDGASKVGNAEERLGVEGPLSRS
ncbi:general substrate transporter [Lasiosphaeria ovina]|uniref:General substrate transporter n=1 Tax=Lasiosphaeria ovina TaxID=92902 RepID=A0AAE0KMH7_9PEZI|nr:general substrate transporter [Lasiosphaeria ovina]